MTKVYDIQGKELNIGDTVAFSYATNKALVIGTVNQIGKSIKRSYGVKFIGTRINIGHTSVWAKSDEQVLLIKSVLPEPELPQTPSHKTFLAVVNYDHETQIAKEFDSENECKVWLFDEIEMDNCDELIEACECELLPNGFYSDTDKVLMYDEFGNYNDDWDENGHILAWSETKQYYGRF